MSNAAWQAREWRLSGELGGWGHQVHQSLDPVLISDILRGPQVGRSLMPEKVQHDVFQGRLLRPKQSMGHHASYSHSVLSADEVQFRKVKEAPSKGILSSHLPLAQYRTYPNCYKYTPSCRQKPLNHS